MSTEESICLVSIFKDCVGYEVSAFWASKKYEVPSLYVGALSFIFLRFLIWLLSSILFLILGILLFLCSNSLLGMLIGVTLNPVTSTACFFILF